MLKVKPAALLEKGPDYRLISRHNDGQTQSFGLKAIGAIASLTRKKGRQFNVKLSSGTVRLTLAARHVTNAIAPVSPSQIDKTKAIAGRISFIKAMILTLAVFFTSLLYLHQKVQIYVGAYQLSKNNQRYNELADRRDYLKHEFAGKVSLEKINQWAQANSFLPVDRDRMLALKSKEKAPAVARNQVASLIDRAVKSPVVSASALANGTE